MLDLVGKPRAKVCIIPTATGDSTQTLVGMYQRFPADRAERTHLALFNRTVKDIRSYLLEQDIILVGGGNTANMLAIWRVHGFDRVLREAWEAGVVLAGWSAGMICWFEAGVTDSFGPELAGMRDGLGFLPGSACPHYDGEERRRPVYTELVRAGFPGGVAADDGVALHYEGTELREVLTTREGATAYRVSVEGEEPLEASSL